MKNIKIKLNDGGKKLLKHIVYLDYELKVEETYCKEDDEFIKYGILHTNQITIRCISDEINHLKRIINNNTNCRVVDVNIHMGNECYYCDFNMTTLTDKEIFEYKQWILKQTKPDRIRLRDMFHYIRDDING